MTDLDNLLHLESMFQEYGRIDGFKQGEKEGVGQGKVMGVEKGFVVAKEIGFYIGYSQCWIKKVEKNPELYPKRLLLQLQQFLELAQSFQLENNLNDDPAALLRNMQSKYRAIQSLSKTNIRYSPEKIQLHY
jgi:hypothetical protein